MPNIMPRVQPRQWGVRDSYVIKVLHVEKKMLILLGSPTMSMHHATMCGGSPEAKSLSLCLQALQHLNLNMLHVLC